MCESGECLFVENFGNPLISVDSRGVLEGLVIAEAMAQGLLQLGSRGKESIVCGSAPQHFPKALNDLQLRTVAR